MIWNNLKTLIYHGMWYFVILSLFFVNKTKAIVEAFIPDMLTRFLIVGIATIVFSIIFTSLFMRPMGSYLNNFTSNGFLILLDIGVIVASVMFFLIGKLTIFEVVLVGLFLLLQIFVVMMVMQLKERRRQRYEEY